MSSIRDRLGLSDSNTSDIRSRLGLTNVSTETPKTSPLKFASRNEKTDNLSSQYKFETLDSKSLKKQYEQELENQTKLQDALKKNLKSKGFTVNVSPFDTTRVSTFGQQASKSIENKKFESTDAYKNIEEDIKNKKEYNEFKQTDEYKNQLEKLTEASNKVGYAKYNYDVAKVAEDDIGWFDKSILGNVLSGAGSIFDYSGGLIKNENGDIVYLPNKSQLKQQKVQESYDNALGKFIGSGAYNLGRIGGSTLLNAVVPYAGSTAYFGKMFQENRDNAVLDGYDGSDATLYALANVTSEVITGKLLGAATKGLTGGKTNEVEKLFGKLASKFTKNPMIISFLSGAGSEATEEFTQEYIDNFLKLALLDKSTKAGDYLSVLGDLDVLGDAAYSAAVGALTGGITNPFQIDSDTNTSAFNEFKQQLLEKRENAKTKAEIKTIDNTIEKLEELSTKSEDELIEMAKEEGLVQEEQPQATETKVEEQPKTEEIAPKEEIKSEDTSKEELTKVQEQKEEKSQQEKNIKKVDNPKDLVFPKILNGYDNFEDILPHINSYDLKQTQHNKVATERMLESYPSSPEINIAQALLTFREYKLRNDPDKAERMSFALNRAEQRLKYWGKKLSDTDKKMISIYADLSDSNVINMIDKYIKTTKVQEQQTKPKQEVKEYTYPNAKNIQQEEGYTAYYDVPAEDYIDIHGRKSAYDIDATTLNNRGFDLITYNDNGTRNIYEFDSKKDLNKYIKAIGGYSALEGQYTIMSNSKEGEFYYVRDKYAKGGWQWEDSSGRILKGTESRTTKLERERQKQLQTIDSVAKQSQLSPKTTTNIKRDVDSIIDESEKTPNQNIDEGNITITNKGISTNINEKMQEDVLKITTPNENPQTISIDEYQVKKPSAKNAAKDLSEQVGTMIDNLSTKEKQEIKNETRKKNTAFKKAQEYAKNTNNKDLTENLNNLEKQAYYNQLDIQENLLSNLLKVYQDLDNAAEKFDADYLNVMAGTPDGSVMEVSSDLVARGQALATYYLDNNMNTEASDVLLKLGKLGTASGQASAQFNAMYQYTPYGIYTQTVNMMDEAYNKIAARKGFNSKWARENNPNTNPNSRFKLTKEQADYILKESTELFDLHGKDFKQYSIRKGKLQNYIGDIIPHGGAEGFINWVRTSLLLGTRTIFKNSGSNILDTAYHAANKINYTIYDKAINKKFGTSIRTAGISLDGQKAGFEAGVKTSIQTLNDIIHGTNTSEFGNRYMDSNLSRENITKDFFGTMPVRYQSKIKKLNAVGNWLSQLSSNTLTWGDAKFAASSYEDNRLTLRKLNALQQYKADNSKNIIYDIKVDDAGTSHVDYINTDGQYDTAVTNDIETFTKENNMTPLKGGDRLDKLALEYSQSRTYTGDTTFSKTTNTILKAIDKAASKVPGIKQLGIKPTNFIVPFSKIGSNLCYKMYRGSILSIPSIKTAYDNFKAEVNSGQVSMKTQHELVSRLGDLTTGTILYITMGSLSKAAFDNVEADEDDDEASKVSKFMKSIFGKDKYTFKVGDYNFSFDVGGNLTNMLKMSLDLQEVSEKEDATLRDYIEVGLKDILSEWTVSNLTELFNEQYNTNTLDKILQTIARVPSMAIPNVVKDVAMTIDNFTQRSVWDEDLGTYAINSIKAKIPFARSTLDAKTDSWGNVMKNGDNLITQFWNTFVVGDQIKKDNSDPVSQELMNLYLITDKVSVIPNSSKSYFSYNSTRYDLDDKEEQQYLQTYAKSAHDNLDKLFNSDLYQNADTESRLKYIEEIYEYANDEAKREYLNKKNIAYYNYGRQVIMTGTNDEYKQSQILDAIDNNISYDSAKQYQKNESKFNYYKSFGSYEAYDSITKNVSDIQTTYSSVNGYSTAQRRQKVIEYVNSLNNLTAVQKAILIKEKYPASYKSYNEKIKEYLKKQNLDDDTYNAMLKSLKIN